MRSFDNGIYREIEIEASNTRLRFTLRDTSLNKTICAALQPQLARQIALALLEAADDCR